jgi:hypothetical protein
MAKYKSWFKPIVKFVKYEPRIYFEAEPDERGIALSRYDKLIEAFDKLNHHFVVFGRRCDHIRKVRIYKVVIEKRYTDETLTQITEMSSMIWELELIRKKRKK